MTSFFRYYTWICRDGVHTVSTAEHIKKAPRIEVLFFA